jgi:hypothetical protein
VASFLVAPGAQYRETNLMSEPDKTLAEFLAQKNLSKTSYYDLKNRGLGPDEIIYPGTRILRITAKAEAAWDERMAQLAQTEAAKLQRERRRAAAVIAGKAAAASERHVSRRKSRPAPAPRRGPQRRRRR